MSHPDILSLHPDIRFRAVDNEGVVVDQRQPEVMVVNGQALRILELIRETGSKKALVEHLVEEYEDDPAIIATDVDRFLAELRDRDMIV